MIILNIRLICDCTREVFYHLEPKPDEVVDMAQELQENGWEEIDGKAVCDRCLVEIEEKTKD